MLHILYQSIYMEDILHVYALNLLILYTIIEIINRIIITSIIITLD